MLNHECKIVWLMHGSELSNKPDVWDQVSGYPWISDPKTLLSHINLLGNAVSVLVCLKYV